MEDIDKVINEFLESDKSVDEYLENITSTDIGETPESSPISSEKDDEEETDE